MADFHRVRVAAAQATPVILDAGATIEKAVHLIATAADQGAQLVVTPTTLVSLYPSNIWVHAAARFGGMEQLWDRMWESSVDVPGAHVDRLAAECEARGVWCVVGV